MKKLISRVCCLCCVVLVLAACLPFSAFAVDPVSAGVMANAFAQAIAAYGASNGVAMTFDVSNTSGIGESVHELWKDFRAGTQDADDYATLAAALFPDLYYKASSVVGGVSDVYTVGYNISSTYAEEFDNFYNWLLSGPAEMVKVDNSYFQFSDSQIGSSAVPVNVGSFRVGVFSDQPIPRLNSASDVYGSGLPIYTYVPNQYAYVCHVGTALAQDVYCFAYQSSTNYTFCCVSLSSGTACYNGPSSSNTQTANITSSNSSYGTTVYYSSNFISVSASNASYITVPLYSTRSAGIEAFVSYLSDAPLNSVGVKAATNTGVAEFPDTADPNYEAVGKQIPSTVPWDNTAYGDGTGTLTDAQAGAIAAGADTVIARDGVLDLAGTDETTDEPGVDDPPTTDPDDYVVPGLAEIFPFCIPFDIYNFLSALSAQPVAPHFMATLAFPEAVGGTQTIDIDFDSPTWNQLAQLLRLLELLAFIVGLALLTRSMFLRG